MNSIPRKPAPPAIDTSGPRRPDITPTDVLAIASALQARRRAQLGRLSPGGRFRRWGGGLR